MTTKNDSDQRETDIRNALSLVRRDCRIPNPRMLLYPNETRLRSKDVTGLL